MFTKRIFEESAIKLVWLFGSLFVISAIFTAFLAYSPYPYADSWRFWERYIELHTHFFYTLFHYHNSVHPIYLTLFPALIFIKIFGNPRIPLLILIYLSVVSFFLFFFSILWKKFADSKERLFKHFLSVLFLCLFFSLTQISNLIHPFQLQFWLAYFLPFLALLSFYHFSQNQKNTFLWLSFFLSIISFGTMGNGVFTPFFVGILALLLKAKPKISLGFLALGALMLLIFLTPLWLHPDPQIQGASFLERAGRHPLYSVLAPFSLLGEPFLYLIKNKHITHFFHAPVLLWLNGKTELLSFFGFIFSGLLLLRLWLFYQAKSIKALDLTLLSTLAYVFFSILLIFYGRIGFIFGRTGSIGGATHVPEAARYATPTLLAYMLLLLLYIEPVLKASKKVKISVFVFLSFCLLLITPVQLYPLFLQKKIEKDLLTQKSVALGTIMGLWTRRNFDFSYANTLGTIMGLWTDGYALSKEENAVRKVTYQLSLGLPESEKLPYQDAYFWLSKKEPMSQKKLPDCQGELKTSFLKDDLSPALPEGYHFLKGDIKTSKGIQPRGIRLLNQKRKVIGYLLSTQNLGVQGFIKELPQDRKIWLHGIGESKLFECRGVVKVQ